MSQLAPSAPGGSVPVRVRPVRGSDGTSLIVSLDPDVPYERLRDEIRRLFGHTPDRFRHGTARLDLGDRELTLFDVRRLVHLLKGEFAISVTAVYTSDRALRRFVEKELKLQVFPRDPAVDWTEQELALAGDEAPTRAADTVGVVILDQVGEEDGTALTELLRFDAGEEADTVIEDGVIGDMAYADEAAPPDQAPAAPDEPLPTVPLGAAPVFFAGGRRALTVARTLRGGQRVAFPGDVIVFGDVNPGATIEAGGHILVFGALRGLAHAGQHGDLSSVIVSFDLRPTQLRIGTLIAIPADDAARAARGFHPEVAWIRGDRILIEDYRGRLPDPLPSEAAPTGPAREHLE